MKRTGRPVIIAATACILILCVGIWAFVTESRKAASYKEATGLVQAGDAEGAYQIFRKIDNYKDAREKMAELIRDDPSLPYRMLTKGDTITFGVYEQNNDLSDGEESMEWVVLDIIGDEILLLSENCIDCRVYNDVPFEPVTWEKCALRKWLNEDFYANAFSEEEKQLIKPAENKNPDQSALGTEGGADTEDCVYILSEIEAGIYMGNEMDREYIGKAPATEYAIDNGAKADENGMTEWWLRTPGGYEYTAQFVETSGTVYTSGAYVDLSYAVRPAIWLSVGKNNDER